MGDASLAAHVLTAVLVSRLITVAVALSVLAAPSADAKTKHRCRRPSSYPPRTLSVRGMQCSEGFALVRRLFRDHPNAYRVPFGQRRTFRTSGWAGLAVKVERTFRCSVLYTNGTGSNRGGILLRVTCHDFNGDAIYYTEEQDNE